MCLYAFDIVTSFNYNTVHILQTVWNIFFIITYFFIFNFHFKNKGKNKINPYDRSTATYSSILNDPITRTCLFYHMLDSHQQEKYIILFLVYSFGKIL